MRKPCSLRRVLTESLVNGSGVAHRDRAEHASRPIMGRSGSSHHYSPGYWSCSHWRLGLRHPERCQRPRPSPPRCRYQSQPCGTDRRAHDRWTKLPFGTASAGRRTRYESHSLAGCPATRAARPTAVRSGLCRCRCLPRLASRPSLATRAPTVDDCLLAHPSRDAVRT